MYNNLKIIELREIAKSRGLRGWTRFNKSDLISFIEKRERELKPKDMEKYHELYPEEEELKK